MKLPIDIRMISLAGLVFLGVLATCANGGTLSPVQSTARPVGHFSTLTMPVYEAGSDPEAAAFQANVLPLMAAAGQMQLGEGQAVTNLNALALDPEQMTMTYSVIPRIYFVGEGAGYHNSLLAQVTRANGDVEDPVLLFPDASTSASYLHSAGALGMRSTAAPLLAGDYVELNTTLSAGDKMALHLIANGAKGGSYLYSTDAALNADGLGTHAVSLSLQENTVEDYVLIGFEDLFGGGDMDYNDLVLAIFYGSGNIGNMPSLAPRPVPVPPAAFGLLAGLGLLRLVARPAAR